MAFSILIKIVQYMVGGEFLDIVKDLVIAAASTEYTAIKPNEQFPEGLSANQQRKIAVTNEIKRLKGDLNPKIKGFGGWLVSLAIDTVVGKLQSKNVI